ncbi:MAG: hypothetical protein WD228_08970 [Mycobacterium sp.]
MSVTIPYARVVALALGSVALLATALNLIQGDWIAALHLSVVVVFTIITLSLAAHSLIVAIGKWARRRREDGSGIQDDYGLAA